MVFTVAKLALGPAPRMTHDATRPRVHDTTPRQLICDCECYNLLVMYELRQLPNHKFNGGTIKTVLLPLKANTGELAHLYLLLSLLMRSDGMATGHGRTRSVCVPNVLRLPAQLTLPVSRSSKHSYTFFFTILERPFVRPVSDMFLAKFLYTFILLNVYEGVWG